VRVLLSATQLRRRVPGGIGTYVRALVQALVRLGDADGKPVQVFLGVHGSLSGLEAASVEEVRLRPTQLPRVAGLLGRRRAGFDVCHASSLELWWGPHRPLVACVHDLAWRKFPEGFSAHGRRWHESALRFVLGEAEAFVVPSALTSASLVEAGADPGRIEVIEHGSDHLPPPDFAGLRSVLVERRIRGSLVAAIGTLEPRKNLARLLEAWRLARPELGSDASLVLAGPVGWGERLVLPEGAFSLGELKPSLLAALYAQALVVVYVPILEGFGLPVLEAFAHGAVVVSTEVPAAGGASLLADGLDPADIASKLVAACSDDGLRSRLKVAAKHRAAELTWERSALRHVEVWRKVACL
jgi:glycosyltransferase involved in cell wall biosynthesis